MVGVGVGAGVGVGVVLDVQATRPTTATIIKHKASQMMEREIFFMLLPPVNLYVV